MSNNNDNFEAREVTCDYCGETINGEEDDTLADLIHRYKMHSIASGGKHGNTKTRPDDLDEKAEQAAERLLNSNNSNENNDDEKDSEDGTDVDTSVMDDVDGDDVYLIIEYPGVRVSIKAEDHNRLNQKRKLLASMLTVGL